MICLHILKVLIFTFITASRQFQMDFEYYLGVWIHLYFMDVLAIRWWEGTITELNDLDETKVTVYFPGENDTQIVKTWDLRPSLQWDGGKWAPWTGPTVIQVSAFF